MSNTVNFKLTLIRHGITKSNIEKKYIGATDEPLSEEGKNTLFKLKEQNIYNMPDKLFVSPMIRCIQTAEILFPKCEYHCIHEWKEFDFGIFEGKSHAELDGNIYYQNWLDSNCELPIEKGEGKAGFIKRTLIGFGEMLSFINRYPPSYTKGVTAVVHGGTIMALLSGLYGGDFYDYYVECLQGYSCNVSVNDSGSIWLSQVRKTC